MNERNQSSLASFGMGFIGADLTLAIVALSLRQVYVATLRAELVAYSAPTNVSGASRNISLALTEIQNVRAGMSTMIMFVSGGILVTPPPISPPSFVTPGQEV